LNTFSAASHINSKQQQGHVFNSAFDSAYESGQSRGDLQTRSYGSSDLSRSVEGESGHGKGSGSSSEAPAGCSQCSVSLEMQSN
jgi:hypothetical protein